LDKGPVSIGVIGFGRFGRLTARYLATDFEMVVASRSADAAAVAQLGARPGTLAEACAQSIVVPCVPISRLQDVLAAMKPLLAADSLVADVCSVKQYPVEWMQTILPPTTPILATHPMFGPDSAARSLKGQKIVLCPVRLSDQRYQRIKSYLESLGLKVYETTPEEHDRQISVSLALTHYIGRSLKAFGARPLDIDTEGYQRLLHILGVVENDTWQLFEDMNRYNPHAAGQREKFRQALATVEERLAAGGATPRF